VAQWIDYAGRYLSLRCTERRSAVVLPLRPPMHVV